MKFQSTTFLAQLSRTTINKLTAQVAETLALKNEEKKIFTSADLWNIQKQRRTFMVRRNFA